MVLSNDLILRQLLLPELYKREQLKDAKFVSETDQGKLVLAYYASQGGLRYEWESENYNSKGFKVDSFLCSFAQREDELETRMRAEIADDSFYIRWNGMAKDCEGHGHWRAPSGGAPISNWYDGYYNSMWEFSQRLHWSLSTVGDRKHITMRSAEGNYNFETKHMRGGDRQDSAAKPEYEAGLNDVKVDMREKFEWLQNDIKDLGFELDAFRLNGLLFSDESVVEPEVLRVPGDMCVLGKLSAARTEYTLTPAMPVVAAGVTFTFTIEPASSGFNWHVENVPGDTGYVGTIENGVYTPPSAESFGHTFKRAIVTASKGEWTGKALVNVVATPLSVFPLVATVGAEAGYTLWAASVDGKELTATVEGNAEGDVVAGSDPFVQQVWKYKTEITVPEEGWNPPLEDLLDYVLRVDKVVIKSASHGVSNEIAMIVPLASTGQYFVEVVEAKSGGETAALQMELWSKGFSSGTYPISPEDVMWRLLVGKGTLDEITGVYTPKAGVHEHYFAVAGLHLTEGKDDEGNPIVVLKAFGYKIIPVPFVSLEKLNSILGDAVQEVSHG